MFMRSGYSAQTRSSRSTEHHHTGADMLRGPIAMPGRLARKAGAGALGLERRCVDAVELDHVAAGVERPVGGDGLADALDRHAVPAVADGHRLGRVQPPVVLAHVREWKDIGAR